jgi:hypothetical protein
MIPGSRLGTPHHPPPPTRQEVDSGPSPMTPLFNFLVHEEYFRALDQFLIFNKQSIILVSI